MGKYAKGIVAVIGAAIVALQLALEDNSVSNAEWVTIALALVTAVGVYLIPNSPPSTPPA